MTGAPHSLAEWAALLFAAIGGGGLARLIDRWRSRRRGRAEVSKLEAEAEVTLAGGYRELVDKLREDVHQVRAEVSELRERAVRAEQRAENLERQLHTERLRHAEEIRQLRERIRQLEQKGIR